MAVPHIQADPPAPQQLVDNDGETKPTLPGRASKRQHTAPQNAPEQGTVLEASTQTGMGDEQHSLAAELPVAAAAGVHPFGQPALPDSWAREPVLGMDFLELSDTLIAFAQYGHVLQVGSLCRCWTLPGLALHTCCTMYSVCGHLAMP